MLSGVPSCNSPAHCHHNLIYISSSENIDSEEGAGSQRIQGYSNVCAIRIFQVEDVKNKLCLCLFI